MNLVIRALGIVVLALMASRCSAGDQRTIRRFDVVPVDDKAILIDTATGATWLLEKLPTSENKSGHVWQKIPSPFPNAIPVEMREIPNLSDQAPTGESLVPLVTPPFSPLIASSESLARSVTLEIKSPSKVAIGDSAMFMLHVTGKNAQTISEVCIQLPSSLKPTQASEGYRRDGSSFIWQNVRVLPDRTAAYAVRSKTLQLDEDAVIRCTAAIDGKVFQVEKKVAIHAKSVPGDPSWQPLEASDPQPRK